MRRSVLALPFPPSVNNLYTHGVVKGRVRRFPSPHYKKWRDTAVTYAKLHRIPMHAGHVAVTITLTPPQFETT